VDQRVESLLCKSESLSSNPRPTKKQTKQNKNLRKYIIYVFICYVWEKHNSEHLQWMKMEVGNRKVLLDLSAPAMEQIGLVYTHHLIKGCFCLLSPPW
jgi:hypothetical protein